MKKIILLGFISIFIACNPLAEEGKSDEELKEEVLSILNRDHKMVVVGIEIEAPHWDEVSLINLDKGKYIGTLTHRSFVRGVTYVCYLDISVLYDGKNILINQIGKPRGLVR